MSLRFELDVFLKANPSDYLPQLGLGITELYELNKMEVTVSWTHKSNSQNEVLFSKRNTKFMCALVAAIRKVPIAKAGGTKTLEKSTNRVGQFQAQGIEEHELSGENDLELTDDTKSDDLPRRFSVTYVEGGALLEGADEKRDSRKEEVILAKERIKREKREEAAEAAENDARETLTSLPMMQKMALNTSVNLEGLIGSGTLGLRTKATGDGTMIYHAGGK
jgi:hypothetical protein